MASIKTLKRQSKSLKSKSKSLKSKSKSKKMRGGNIPKYNQELPKSAMKGSRAMGAVSNTPGKKVDSSLKTKFGIDQVKTPHFYIREEPMIRKGINNIAINPVKRNGVAKTIQQISKTLLSQTNSSGNPIINKATRKELITKYLQTYNDTKTNSKIKIGDKTFYIKNNGFVDYNNNV
jgi:hypothetical protein